MSDTIPDLIRKQVAADVRISPIHSMFRIGTPLCYDDGDSCEFYLNCETSGNWFFTDLGDVLTRAGYSDVDLLAEGYQSRVERASEFFGMRIDNGNMVLPVEESGIGDAIFIFAQASLELVGISRTPQEKKKRKENKFRQRFDDLIKAVVPTSNLQSNWHDESLDPDGLYPVDFRIHTGDSEWYVFGVGTPNKCLHTTISCQRYRLLSRRFSSLAIYREKEKLPVNATKTLDEVVEQKFPSITEDREKIAHYIETNILKAA